MLSGACKAITASCRDGDTSRTFQKGAAIDECLGRIHSLRLTKWVEIREEVRSKCDRLLGKNNSVKKGSADIQAQTRLKRPAGRSAFPGAIHPRHQCRGLSHYPGKRRCQGHQRAHIHEQLDLWLKRCVEKTLENPKACVVYQEVNLEPAALHLSDESRYLFLRGEISRKNRYLHF